MGAVPLQEGIIYTLNLVEDQALIAQGYEDIEYITPPENLGGIHYTCFKDCVCVLASAHLVGKGCFVRACIIILYYINIFYMCTHTK